MTLRILQGLLLLLLLALPGCPAPPEDAADSQTIPLPVDETEPIFYAAKYRDIGRRPPMRERFAVGETPALYVEETDRRTVSVKLFDLENKTYVSVDTGNQLSPETPDTLRYKTDYPFEGNWMLFPMPELPTGQYLAELSVAGEFRKTCSFHVDSLKGSSDANAPSSEGTQVAP